MTQVTTYPRATAQGYKMSDCLQPTSSIDIESVGEGVGCFIKGSTSQFSAPRRSRFALLPLQLRLVTSNSTIPCWLPSGVLSDCLYLFSEGLKPLLDSPVHHVS